MYTMLTQNDASLICTINEQINYDSVVVHQKGELLRTVLLEQDHPQDLVRHFIRCLTANKAWHDDASVLNSAKKTRHFKFIGRINSGIVKKRNIIKRILEENKDFFCEPLAILVTFDKVPVLLAGQGSCVHMFAFYLTLFSNLSNQPKRIP